MSTHTLKRTLAALMILALGLAACPAVAENGDAALTLMIYICGSDLESENGAATADIEEMLAARTSKEVNIVLQTGGASDWENDAIDSGTVQRFEIADGELLPVETVGTVDMCDPDTLAGFIADTAEAYPAERYELVLWDHGGGPLYGYGSDELFSADDSMTLPEIAEALDRGGIYFDIIGFDACLMGSVEVALAMAPYADYMIASENTEPGVGWYYTSWLDALSQTPALDAVSQGEIIVEDFIDVCSDDPESRDATLSMIDLEALYSASNGALATLAEESGALLAQGDYDSVARARGKSASYGYAEDDLIDIASFVALLAPDSQAEILEALDQAVVVNGAGRAAGESNGLSMYFPYNYLEAYADMQAVYGEIDGAENVAQLTGAFAAYCGSGNDQIDSESFFGMFDSETFQAAQTYVTEHSFSGDELVLTESNGSYRLELSASEWALIDNVQLQLNVFDDEGQIVLGFDDAVQYADDGSLIADFDNSWVALNGEIVPYYSGEYLEFDDYYCYTGYVPVALNGQDAELVLIWDSDHPDGKVLGTRDTFSNALVIGHGLRALKDGDVLQPYCEYYYDDADDATYFDFGDEIVVSGEIQVSYEDLGDFEGAVCYLLTDVYGNEYTTEVLMIG